MKIKKTIKDLRKIELKNSKKVKGGFRASNLPGGSGGTGFIDWGDVDVRSDFGSIVIKKDGQISTAYLG